VVYDTVASPPCRLAVSRYADFVYDFALPRVTLHALFPGTPKHLKQWLRLSPRHAFTALDTQDGISIIDAGPSSNTAENRRLSASEIDLLVNSDDDNRIGNHRIAIRLVASNVDLYQDDCTFF